MDKLKIHLLQKMKKVYLCVLISCIRDSLPISQTNFVWIPMNWNNRICNANLNQKPLKFQSMNSKIEEVKLKNFTWCSTLSMLVEKGGCGELEGGKGNGIFDSLNPSKNQNLSSLSLTESSWTSSTKTNLYTWFRNSY